MQYQFREVGFEGKVIRFIKPLNFDSDELISAPIDKLNKIANAIEAAEPNTIVVMMLGRSDTGINKNLGERALLLTRFWRSYRRLPDEYYDWDSAES